jgi:hypothetical protein
VIVRLSVYHIRCNRWHVILYKKSALHEMLYSDAKFSFLSDISIITLYIAKCLNNFSLFKILRKLTLLP